MTENEMTDVLLEAFAGKFGPGKRARVFFAPGRVNLIGEHTDYNGGHVFPCALTIGTYGAARRRKDRRLRLYSLNFPDSWVYETSLDRLGPGLPKGWASYPAGVIHTLREKGFAIDQGLDMAVWGDIPSGSGLSSSASLEVLTGALVRSLFGLSLTNRAMALICQESENRYNGVACGIMDQFACANGREGKALFLDTGSLSCTYVPLHLDGASLVIANTNKKHSLAQSAYNDRRQECQQALAAFQRVKNIHHLCDMSPAEFEQCKEAVADPILLRRARHAVYENARTIDALQALRAGDLKRFGQLMKESHISLSRDYQVTGPELDTLASQAWKIPGCIGSRMTGGGFGGCTVSIVENKAVSEFIDRVGRAYEKEIGKKADFYVMQAGGGPRQIK